MSVKSAVLTAFVAMAGIQSAAASVITHYDVNFNSDTAGLAPTIDSSSTTPSRIIFGEPIVESSFGALTDQALVFNTAGSTMSQFYYDQIGFNLNKGYDNYQFEFDLSIDGLIGSDYHFTALLDTPIVQNFHLNPDGTASTQNVYTSSVVDSLGGYSENELLHVLFDVDLSSNLWSIKLNDLLVLSDDEFYSESGDIKSFRLSLGTVFGGSSNDPSVFVGLDNLKITSIVNDTPSSNVPLPGTLPLLTLAGLLLLGRKIKHS